MSILLEALRKTEKSQKKQPVPTIHSEEQGRPGPEPLKTSPLLAMIAVTLIVSGWFTWRQYELPEGVYQPPVTLSRTQMRSGGDQAVAENTQVVKDTAVAKPGPAPASPSTDATPARQQRTPVETYQAPVASTSEPDSAGASTGWGSDSRADGTSSSSSRAVATRQSAGAFNQPASSAAAGNSAKPVEQATPHIPEPIGYWELPDAVRAEVPEIRYSVLVYNKDPAQRFVLVEGQRLGEGDSAQPGLVVEEIRRDGVIFSYRLYKFLVRL